LRVTGAEVTGIVVAVVATVVRSRSADAVVAGGNMVGNGVASAVPDPAGTGPAVAEPADDVKSIPNGITRISMSAITRMTPIPIPATSHFRDVTCPATGAMPCSEGSSAPQFVQNFREGSGETVPHFGQKTGAML